MTDPTNDTHIEELLDNLGGGYWPEKHAALTALVVQRNALLGRVAVQDQDIKALSAANAILRGKLTESPPADRDLRERLVCAALTGLCADPSLNGNQVVRGAIEFADEIERLRAKLAAEGATTASLLRIIALIREAGGFTREDLDALPGAVKAMRQQRDEARREVCRYWAFRSVVVLGVYRSALDFAADRGWDCYAKEGGGA